MQEFFVSIKYFSVIAHVFGVALGLGSILVNDYFLMRFLKKGYLEKKEAEFIKQLTPLIWTGLGIIFLSGLCLFLTRPEDYGQSSKFLVKMVSVAVLAINGWLVGKFILPHLTELFGKGENFRQTAALAMGGVSIASWLWAFILGLTRKVEIGFWPLVLIYFLSIAVAAAGAVIMEKLKVFIKTKKAL